MDLINIWYVFLNTYNKIFKCSLQVFVGKVAENVDPSKKELSWTLPEVISPKSTIYFLQFYDSNNVTEKTWSTRFTITDENGEFEPPFHEKQPKTDDNASNKNTPWGIGKLTDGRVDQSQLPLHHNYPASDEAETKLKDGGKKNDELQETSDSNELIKFNVYMLITLVLVVVISS